MLTRSLGILATLTLTAGLCLAQSEAGSSALQGVVVDPSGATVKNAELVISNEGTGYQRKATSGPDGRFFVPVLPVGTYRLAVSAAGFKTAEIKQLNLLVGESTNIEVKLDLPNVSSSVTVASEATAVDPEQTATSNSIGQRAIEELPVRGRNFVEFVQLTPGVMQEADRGGLVFAGQRSINSNVAIDGGDFNDALQGNQRGGNQATFFFPQSAVREFQVVRSGATAEVGRTSAGFVNVVTKSGTNQYHGDAFYFNRNKPLTSPDAFGRQLDAAQNQFGGSIGGPIKRDKAFFFVAAEQNLLRVPFVVKFAPQAASVVVPADLKALEGEQRGTNNPTSIFVRQDTQLTSRHSLNVAYNFTRMRGENFNFESAQIDLAPTANYLYKSDSQAGKVGLVSLLTPRLVNELRGQIATDFRREDPNVFTSQIVINGFGTIGSDTGRPRVFEAMRYQLADNLSYSKGAHFLRFGFDFNANSFSQERESNTLGRYDFTNLANYLARNISRYRQTVAGFDPNDLIYTGTGQELAFFINDKWTVRRNLTISAGVRWEGQWNPQPKRPNPAFPQTARIPNDLNMWQPRFGLSWSPGTSKRTVVRLSAGLLSARTPANLFQRVSTDNGITTVAVDSRTDANILRSLTFPNPLTSLPAGTRVVAPRIFGFAADFQNPQSAQFSVEVEQALTNDVKFSVGYIRNSSWHLQRRLDRNLFAPTINAFGVAVYPTTRPNPSIGVLSINESSAHSNYDGLLLSMSKRFSRRFQLGANYTYSTAYDDDSNERNFSKELALNVFNLQPERAFSKQDIRHNFNTNALVNLPWNVTLAGIMIARSGVPYTRVTGSDSQNDANDDNDRAVVNGVVSPRNGSRQPKFFDLDIRLIKRFQLGERRALLLSAEGFNVTKHANRNFGVDGISIFGNTPNVPGSAADLALSAPSTARYGGPRQLQLGMRFEF